MSPRSFKKKTALLPPVTYFHNNTDDVYVYILNKTLPLEVSSHDGVNYNYTVEDNILTINFLTVTELDEVVIRNIVNSMNVNFEFDQITITASSNVIYNESYLDA